ncbi:hypothetical protein OTU49_003096 [Cherax quadricarinatus]|uniref:Uncharacterized protein n=1 Tax=Cherax quadricarinatus TaxID=27406 RepID=A0AAW0XKH1_CHEQU|nr:mucin-5AC-like isoform X2 [Cherax quadricarinatus]
MAPPATRWLCLHLLFLLTHIVKGQLSVGGADSFLIGDFDVTGSIAENNADSLINATNDAETTEDAESHNALTSDDLTTTTTKPAEDTTIPDFEDLTDELEATTDSSVLHDDRLNKRMGVMEYFESPTDLEMTIDSFKEAVSTTTVPQLTRRIIFSGEVSLTPTVPEQSAAFTRPSSLVRVLTDEDEWLPNWPSHLLDNGSRPSRRPTIRFPTDPPPTAIALPSVSSVPQVPSILPSFTVSKVPVTQYFFDLPSVAPTPVPGPLFDQDDLSLSGLASPSTQPDFNRPVIELSSSISELQSSALFEAARPFTVTPSLSNSHSSMFAEAEVTFVSHTQAATPATDFTPSLSSVIPNGVVGSEVINLDELNGDNLTVIADEAQDLSPQTTGQKPPQDHLDSPGDDDYYESTTAGDISVDESTSTDSVLPGIDDLQLVSSATTTSRTPSIPASGSGLVTTTRTNALGSVKPTFIRTSQAANSSRTPLWMLLSQSSPSRTVNTQPLSTQRTSSAITPASNTITAFVTSRFPNDASITEALESEVSSAPTLTPSTLSTEDILETFAQSPTTSLNDFSVQPTLESDSLTDVIFTPYPEESIYTTPNLASLSIFPTEDITDYFTSKPLVTESIEIASSDAINLDTEFSKSKIPYSSQTIFQPISLVSLTEVNEVTPLTDSATWTPVLESTENTIQSMPVASLTPITLITANVSHMSPEMTGGFTPIRSETIQPSIFTENSDILPDISSIPFPISITALVESTATHTAPFDDFSTEIAPSTSVSDFFATSIEQENGRESESAMLSEPSVLDEYLTSSVIENYEVESSPIAFPTADYTPLKNEHTSIPLVTAFTELVSTSPSSSSAVSEEKSSVVETNPEPTIIVTEKLPSFPTMFVPEIFPSSSGIPVSVTPSATDITSKSSLPPLASVLLESSESTITHDIPMSSASVATLPTSFASSNLDSQILVAPTAIGVATESSTHVHLEEPIEGTEGGTHGESPEKESTTVERSSSSSTSGTPTPVTVKSPMSTTTATKTSTTKVTIPQTTTTTTTAVPTTSSSEVPIFITPTETTPSLTTLETLSNGTVVKCQLPFIRALVAYSNGEFCHHKKNFRSLLSQWISRHLEGKVYVEPHEIEFFNMPDCSVHKPSSVEHSHPQSEVNKTNVYFYVTSAGKINPNLTKQFPLFPMDIKISEDLTYLKPKVSQLELMTAKHDDRGPTNTNPLQEKEASVGTSAIVIIVICSIVGVTVIAALLFFMVVKRRGSTNNYYGRRCTPVSMDAYSMDSVSVYRSFRRKSKRRASGRSVKSYLNQAFDDPNGPTRLLNFAKLTHFISDIDGVYEEFGTIPVNMPKYDELPSGVEDKNRYANVIPVPETRVVLKLPKDSHNSEYINANYVRGARNESKYYIATQAPLDDTVADFWRMIWEQETKVVVMLTDFVEKGIDKCADYLPPSETLDCHRLYGDFQVTLKSRDMREKFVVSNVQLKNLENNLVREVAHMWFTGWPASGVPNEETAFISFILDVRRTRKKLRAKGPILVHCSPGTGRTGTFLACDIVMRQFEDQRSVDVPRTVYSIRRDRAGAVQTKEQYAFIYRVINLYASKLTSGNLDSL